MALRVGTPLPSFEGATLWLNEELVADNLQHRFVVVHFWAVSCPACLHAMRGVEEWKHTLDEQHVRWISVHWPRIKGDKKVETVQETLRAYGITGPCAIDNSRVIATRFETGDIWPYYFLFDAQHKMRVRAAGGTGFNVIRSSLHRLLPSYAAEPFSMEVNS